MKTLNKNIIKDLKKSKYAELIPDFKEEKTRKFTTLALTIIALSFFSLFAINPTLSTIAKLNKEIEDNKFVHEQLQRKINNLTELQQKYSQVQQDLSSIYSSIPQKSDIPLLVGQIQTLARENSLEVTSLQTFQVEVSEGGSKNKFTSFSFSVNANGNYQNISEFINDLVNMQRIINIENLAITRRTTETNSLQLSLRGTAFFKP